MMTYYAGSKVLLIADMAIQNDSRYTYKWTLEPTHTIKDIVYGYKVYYQFDEIGIKNIFLDIIDKETGYISSYTSKVCIVQRSFRQAGSFALPLDANDFSLTLIQNFGSEYGFVDGMMFNKNILISDIGIKAVYGGDPLLIANKHFKAVLSLNSSDIIITGYTDIFPDVDGFITSLTNDTTTTGYNITFRIGSLYNLSYANISISIYEVNGSSETLLINGNKSAGQIFVRLVLA